MEHPVFGTLDKPDSCSFGKYSVIDDSPNTQKIVYELDDVIMKFKVRRDHVNLLICDAAAYTCRAGKVLKEIFPNLLHVPVMHINA